MTTSNQLLHFTNTYTYDPAGQLTAATTTDPAVLIDGNVRYRYDPAGNRTQVAIAGVIPTNYTYDAANQLTSDTVHTYTHDAAGNLTSRTPAGQANLATSYDFDSLNRLVNIQEPTGTIVDHTYDNMGRRASTTTTDPDGNTTSNSYLYDGWDLLNTVASDDDTAYTTVGGRVLAATTGPRDTHYHPDATGNIGEATDRFGNVITRNAYTPYGQTTSIPPSPDPDNPRTQYGYSGAWGVRDAGNDLLDMRNRTYDPTLGQFLSRDPLESLTGDAYSYASGDPISRIDPSGLAPDAPRRRREYAPVGCSPRMVRCQDGGAEGQRAWDTAPPGTDTVRCSDRMGCRAYVNGHPYPCPGGDCGYGPREPSPTSSGGGFRDFLGNLGNVVVQIVDLAEGCAGAVIAGQAFIWYTAGTGPGGKLVAYGALCVGGAAISALDPNPPGFYGPP